MAKGMFMDPFGIKPETCRWIIGGLDWPMKPIDFVTKPHPANGRRSAGPQTIVFGREIYSVCPIEVLDLGIIISLGLLGHLLGQLSVNQREFWLWLRSL